MNEKKSPKVSVCVLTYNQEKYIGQCLQSLVDQTTNFQYEIIVGDDCSTDNTRSIILEFEKKYPTKIKPIFHEKNIGMCKNHIYIHAAANGEYVAHMDGDDYALPGKLQIQNDYLDANRNCVIVWHKMLTINEKNEITNNSPKNKFLYSHIFQQKDLLSIGTIANHSSKFYRKSASIDEYPNEFLDFYCDIMHLNYGSGAILEETLGVYRSGIGVSSSGTKTRRILINNLSYLSNIYPKYRNEIGALLIKIIIGDIIKKRDTINLTAKILLKNLSIYSIYIFLKKYKFIKLLKS